MPAEDANRPTPAPSTSKPDGLFSTPTEPERSFPTTAVGIAAVAVAILVALLVLMGRKSGPALSPNTVQPLATYAPQLTLSGVEMSEATSLSGGKSTYIDGHIANHGTSTVTGVTVQALFANDQAMPPQVETVALTLIRTRQPYVDTQPVSAAPLAPGGDAEFRLIFENVAENWNQQPPELRVVQVSTR